MLRASRPRAGSPYFLALAAVFFLKSCGTTSIQNLLDDPSKYEGQTVRVAGSVTSSVGILGVGAYQIDDGTGKITIVTQSGVPREGAKAGVEGKFQSAFTLGTQTAAVIVEERRKTQ